MAEVYCLIETRKDEKSPWEMLDFVKRKAEESYIIPPLNLYQSLEVLPLPNSGPLCEGLRIATNHRLNSEPNPKELFEGKYKDEEKKMGARGLGILDDFSEGTMRVLKNVPDGQLIFATHIGYDEFIEASKYIDKRNAKLTLRDISDIIDYIVETIIKNRKFSTEKITTMLRRLSKPDDEIQRDIDLFLNTVRTLVKSRLANETPDDKTFNYVDFKSENCRIVVYAEV